jgi:dynein heavy chain 2
MDYPDNEQLKAVYTAYMEAALTEQCPRSPVAALASAMLAVYELVRKHFTADARPHYLFTPRDLTHWVLGLLRYDLTDDSLLGIW